MSNEEEVYAKLTNTLFTAFGYVESYSSKEYYRVRCPYSSGTGVGGTTWLYTRRKDSKLKAHIGQMVEIKYTFKDWDSHEIYPLNVRKMKAKDQLSHLSRQKYEDIAGSYH